MNYRLLDDEMLIKLLKVSDENAFREIYLRYWKSLYVAALKKVQVKETAEEIVQNVIISVWHKRAASNIQHLQSYLNTAIKYQVINHLKAKICREKKHHELVARQLQSENTGENVLIINELSLAIDRAIKMLPEKTGLVFKLNRLENHSVKEISAHMNISEKAVEYHITKSLKIMRGHLKEFIALAALMLQIPW